MTLKEKDLKNEDDINDEDNLKNERNLNDMMGEVTLKKSEDSTKNEDYPKY